jgi:proteic killer suppression protein
MIRSFGDKRTETLFWDGVVREFRSIAPRAKRKLEAINAASRLEDLRVPPSNRLEKLKGDLGGFHSIRINDQWRIIFRWRSGLLTIIEWRRQWLRMCSHRSPRVKC